MESLQRAIKILGGQSLLGAAVGVGQSTVAGWVKRKSVPAEYCAAIEMQTGGQVTRKDLWPDDWQRIWPELADSEQNPPAVGLGRAAVAINSEAKEVAHA